MHIKGVLRSLVIKMRNSFIFIFLFTTMNMTAQWQNDSCHKAAFICGDPVVFPAMLYQFGIQQAGPNYGCITPFYPSGQSQWQFFKALTSGPVTLKFSCPTQPTGWALPIIIWGGFETINNVCVNGLTGDKIVFCTMYGGNPYYANFNVIAGRYYYLHFITPQSVPDIPYPVHIQQSNFSTPGHGTLDCSPLSGQECIMNFIISNAGSCNLTSNTFNISGMIGYMYPPTTGFLLIKDLSSGITDTILPPFNAISNFTIENVPCNNAPHYISAWFTDGNCSIPDTIQAPAGGCAVGTLWGGGTYCNPTGPPVIINISAIGGQAPFSFSWSINGVPQPPVTGYSAGWPYVLMVTEPGTYELRSMAGKDCPGTYSGTAIVTTAASPQPTLNDTIVCLGSPVLLDAGAGYASYLWSTGASSQSILVYLAGVYTVSVSNASGCQGSAQATVSNLPIPSPKMIKHE